MNKGDAAMQISTADALSESIPNSEILISTPFPKIDKPLYKDYELVVCSRRRLIWASLQLLRTALWGFINRTTGVKPNWLIPERELQEYLEADLVVDLSGDMLTEDYGPHVAYSHYLPILFAIMLRRPFVVCAQSIGPFRWTRFLARFILNRAEFVTTRDQISLEYLRDMGIRRDTLSMTADMAFLLQPISREQAIVLLEKEGISLREGRPLMGISLSRLVEKKYGKANANAEKAGMVDLFATVLDEVADKHGVDYLFVPHVTGPAESKDDRIILAEVKARMKAHVHVIQGDYTPSELKGMIGLCQAMMGARMHANIGALSSGIPTIAIAYSHKTPGIMGALSQNEMVLDITKLDRQQIIDTTNYLYENCDQIQSVLKSRVARVKELSQLNVNMIREFLV
jgi:colanic acid/amylovoran biosynthesis protein